MLAASLYLSEEFVLLQRTSMLKQRARATNGKIGPVDLLKNEND